MVKQKQLTLIQVAEQSGLSYRQTKRLYCRYKMAGPAGLIHQKRGQPSNRRHQHREAIMQRYKERYAGFGPTLAAEKLSEDDNLTVDHNTLRKWLLAEQLWVKKRKRNPYRRHRERRAQFGELLQIDGSIHDWFEEGQHSCLINMVDDASGKTLARMESGETTRGVFLLLVDWIKKYGVPLALYVDRKTVYVSHKNDGFSHVQRACEKLGIRIIKANSPQAKGRVERNHAVYQDRFVKELRLRNIKTLDEANSVLAGGFIDKLNQKFEKIPANPQDAHRHINDTFLNQSLCWEYQRQVQRDWTFSFLGKRYQVAKHKNSSLKPKERIFIRKHLDGALSAGFNGESLSFRVISARIPARSQPIKTKFIPSSIVTPFRKSSWQQANHRSVLQPCKVG